MNANKRIAKNTAFLYLRMLVVTGTSLYTIRVVLDALGTVDFGLYGVVAGVVTILAFLNGTMSQAAQRFLSVEIGTSDAASINRTFNTILAIHLGIACGVILLGESFGHWLLNSKMSIPDTRMESASTALQFAILTGAALVLQTPFNALIIAHERMGFFALVSLVEAGLRLAIAWGISHSTGDRLALYACLTFASTVLTLVAYSLFCLSRFSESAIKLHRDAQAYKSVTSFIGWSFIGNLAAASRSQGINVLLNVFFGPIANASHAIMTQAQTAASNFAGSFQAALNPQIYKRYAQSEIKEMNGLLTTGSKLSFMLLITVVAPVIHSTNYILDTWLTNPPPLAAEFVQWMLVTLLIDSLSQPLITGAMATGRIKAYQLVVGGTILLCLPISYLAFLITGNPKSFLYIILFASIIALALRLFFLRILLKFSVERFTKDVLFRVAAISLAIYAVSVLYRGHFGSDHSLLDLTKSSATISLTAILATLAIGLSRPERCFLINTIKSKLTR